MSFLRALLFLLALTVCARADSLTSAGSGPGPLPGYLSGLTLSNDTTTPATVIDIAAGNATSDDNTTSMSLSTLLAKNLSSWALGGTSASPAGCLDTGSASASTWYNIFEIQRPDTGATDVLCSTSLTPTFPSNYTKKRRLGSIKTTTTAGAVTAFLQRGDDFVWGTLTTTADWSSASPPTANRTLTAVNVPIGLVVRALVAAVTQTTNSSQSLLLTDPAQADVAPASAYPSYGVTAQVGASAGTPTVVSTSIVSVYTNTSAQIGVRASAAVQSSIQAVGWTDTRGK